MNNYINSLLTQITTKKTEVSIRIMAFTQLADQCAGSNDQDICRILAQIVRDESEQRDFRLIAYIILFEISGRRLHDIGSLHDFVMPDDFDWPFVNQYLREKMDDK